MLRFLATLVLAAAVVLPVWVLWAYVLARLSAAFGQ